MGWTVNRGSGRSGGRLCFVRAVRGKDAGGMVGRQLGVGMV
jgi:hypothetical protein